MKAGAQISLYAMTDRFVEVIMEAVEVIRGRSELETRTDDLSTVILGEERALFATARDAFAAAAAGGVHVVLNAHFSRGCPGDDYCLAGSNSGSSPAPERGLTTAPLSKLESPRGTAGEHRVACQFALYPLGTADYMEQIYGVINHAKETETFAAPKNFVSRLDGSVAEVFDELFYAFVTAGSDHTTIHATISANSPSNQQ
jgi:hypothetical protein